MKQEKVLFSDMYGYETIKKTVTKAISILQDDGIDPASKPRGLLLGGAPGCGKTMMSKEIIEELKWPTVYLDNSAKNRASEIKRVFEEGRKLGRAIIVMDELDSFLDNKSEIEGELKAQMDGFADNKSIFVLATANDMDDICSPLLRSGRFDYVLVFQLPDYYFVKEIVEGFFSKKNLPVQEVDVIRISKLCEYMTIADILGILKHTCSIGKGEFDIETFETLHNCMTDKKRAIKDYAGPAPYYICIHEAGHIVETYLNRQYWNFYQAYIDSTTDATTHIYQTEKSYQKDYYNTRVAKIKIDFAGALAEKLFFQTPSMGNSEDYEKITGVITTMVEENFIKGPLTGYWRRDNHHNRQHTAIKTFLMECEETKLFNKLKRETWKELKKHKDKIKEIADLLYTKKEITYRDISW